MNTPAPARNAPKPAPRHYGARLNAFKVGADVAWPGKNRITATDLLQRAATADGLNSADINFPDHFTDHSPAELKACLDDLGIQLNGLATRYYSDPRFLAGAFTNPDATNRRAAIDLTRRGIDAVAEMGGDLMPLWMGQDGSEYAFQADYNRLWDMTLEAMAEVMDHNPKVQVAIEYKPNEPRAFSLAPNMNACLLMLKDLNRPNSGVTIDFAHSLYADETPAMAAQAAHRHAKLLGVQMNDGHGKRDDGMMVASVHPIQTLAFYTALLQIGYDRAIYFDTFPDHTGLDPVAEANRNIEVSQRLFALAEGLKDNEALRQATQAQNGVATMAIVQRALFG